MPFYDQQLPESYPPPLPMDHAPHTTEDLRVDLQSRRYNLARKKHECDCDDGSPKLKITSATISTFHEHMEVGDNIQKDGYITFTLENPDLLEPNSISLKDHNGITVFSNENASPINITHDAWTSRNVGITRWTLQAKSIDGSTVKFEIPVSWEAKVYFGASEDTDITAENVLEALSGNKLQPNTNGEYDFDDPGYKYIAVPTAVGTPVKFTDTGRTGGIVGSVTPFIQLLNISTTNDYGVPLEYSIWRSANRLGGRLSVKVE